MTDVTITLNDGDEYFPPDELIENLRRAYPAINVDQELLRIKVKCATDHAARRSFAQIPKFITSWMAREHDKAAERKESREPSHPEPLGDDELRHLWAGDRIMSALLDGVEPDEPGLFKMDIRRGCERIIADSLKFGYAELNRRSWCHGTCWVAIRQRWAELHPGRAA